MKFTKNEIMFRAVLFRFKTQLFEIRIKHLSKKPVVDKIDQDDSDDEANPCQECSQNINSKSQLQCQLLLCSTCSEPGRLSDRDWHPQHPHPRPRHLQNLGQEVHEGGDGSSAARVRGEWSTKSWNMEVTGIQWFARSQHTCWGGWHRWIFHWWNVLNFSIQSIYHVYIDLGSCVRKCPTPSAPRQP